MRREKHLPWELVTIGRVIDNQPLADVDEVFQTGTPNVPPNPLNKNRIVGIWIIIVVVLSIMMGRLAYLQNGQGNIYRIAVDQKKYRYVRLPAPRGLITDRNNKPIVKNTPNFMLSIVPAMIPSKQPARQDFYQKVSNVAKLEINDIKNKIESALTSKSYSSSEPVPIISNLPYDQALQLSVSISELPGTTVEVMPTRQYVQGLESSSIVGYIGPVSAEDLKKNEHLSLIDEVGKNGIEMLYNQDLMGTDGYVAYEREALNRLNNPVKQQHPKPGNTVSLTIDAELQSRLYQRLETAVKSAHSNGAAAVAVDPRNGEVLALVSYPAYDSNWFNNPGDEEKIKSALTDSRHLFLNRAITGLYPSGSIIKPIIATAALAEDIVTSQTTVLSVGGFKVGVNLFPDWKAGGHGLTNMAKALAESVNTYFYYIGGGYEQQVGLGVERIVKYLGLFGWGKKSGIDLPNEASGFLPTKEWREHKRTSPWRLGDTYHLSIGQGDLEVTPLQVANATAVIANGGTLYQPHLVREISDANGKILKRTNPTVIKNNIANQQDIDAVQNGMRQGVLSGSSRAMQDLPVAVAGKTGTAQFGNQGKTHAWYSVYAPYENPEIALTVIIEGGGEGNATALPVAHDILRWYYTRTAN